MSMDIFEEIVSSWLQTKNYFVMNNIKYGNNQEIDVLGYSFVDNIIVHVEVSCSSNPISMLGARRAEHPNNYHENAMTYINRKFLNDSVMQKIQQVTNNPNLQVYRYFVHGRLAEELQLNEFENQGIRTKHINDIIEEIRGYQLGTFIGDNRLKRLFDIME